jgi:hypothetical protein
MEDKRSHAPNTGVVGCTLKMLVKGLISSQYRATP